ncbi:winged helix-turn-helix domain-containing protein [Streptomyces sp. NBC_00448]|uniref:winged helix-turn-helix domain-containing protein n=1 Tax=Streptomyces sp. NBC_00448 TaxID=2903652 RepID=UPI002E1C5A12
MLDELIHSPVRLSIMATLAAAEEADFRFLRESLEISDSLLSKHAAQLEASGYIRVTKGFVDKRASTWYSLTEDGRTAFARYRRTLADILGGPAADDAKPDTRPHS